MTKNKYWTIEQLQQAGVIEEAITNALIGVLKRTSFVWEPIGGDSWRLSYLHDRLWWRGGHRQKNER